MNRNNLYFLTLITIFTVKAAFGWSYTVTNWAQGPRPLNAKYAGSGWAFGKCFSCCDDNVVIPAGGTVTLNAKACLLTSLNTPEGSSYTSSGQRTYQQFHIIEVGNSFMVGRVVK